MLYYDNECGHCIFMGSSNGVFTPVFFKRSMVNIDSMNFKLTVIYGCLLISYIEKVYDSRY